MGWERGPHRWILWMFQGTVFLVPHQISGYLTYPLKQALEVLRVTKVTVNSWNLMFHVPTHSLWHSVVYSVCSLQFLCSINVSNYWHSSTESIIWLIQGCHRSAHISSPAKILASVWFLWVKPHAHPAAKAFLTWEIPKNGSQQQNKSWVRIPMGSFCALCVICLLWSDKTWLLFVYFSVCFLCACEYESDLFGWNSCFPWFSYQ